MFKCILCEKEWLFTSHLCVKCRRIKHLINLYEDKVYETLENCLVRNNEQITRKENVEIKKEQCQLESVIENRKNKK